MHTHICIGAMLAEELVVKFLEFSLLPLNPLNNIAFAIADTYYARDRSYYSCDCSDNKCYCSDTVHIVQRL